MKLSRNFNSIGLLEDLCDSLNEVVIEIQTDALLSATWREELEALELDAIKAVFDDFQALAEARQSHGIHHLGAVSRHLVTRVSERFMW